MKQVAISGIGVTGGLLIFLALFFLPDTQVESINDILLHFPGLDKVTHFLEHIGIILGIYFVLAKTPLRNSHGRKLAVALTCSILFSIADETHQIYIPGRYFEKADLAANTLGAITGIIIVSYCKFRPLIFVICILAPLIAITFITYDSYARLKPYYTGMLLEKNQKFQSAREQYILALEAGNQSGEIYNNIAWLDLEFLDEDPQQALAFAKKAMDIDSGNADFLDTYGWALLQVGRTAESLVFLKQAYAIKPDIYCIHYHLGRAYLALGDNGKAIFHLQKQIQINPDDRFGIRAKTTLSKITQRPENESFE
jgi:VanZ family protein